MLSIVLLRNSATTPPVGLQLIAMVVVLMLVIGVKGLDLTNSDNKLKQAAGKLLLSSIGAAIAYLVFKFLEALAG